MSLTETAPTAATTGPPAWTALSGRSFVKELDLTVAEWASLLDRKSTRLNSSHPV